MAADCASRKVSRIMIEYFESVYLLHGNQLALMLTSGLAFVSLTFAVLSGRALKKFKRKQHIENQRFHDDMRALSKAAVGMGQKVLDTERRLQDLMKKQFALLNSQPEHPSYDQASHLIRMGATEQDLVSSCGFSHAEAELLLSLNKHSDSTAKLHH